ncbi:MAG: sulfotransferase [Planctomycetales bacterium]
METSEKKTLVLCGGTQSSGSTLLSWCFLQRSDMDGVLDADNDVLPAIDPSLAVPLAWYKTTICCFRLTELARHFQDDGWDVRPLLVLRDVRKVWASLSKKRYARNGITAEDPPMRLRMRRFQEDWRLFRENDWPTLRYESLLIHPEAVLRRACEQLEIPWDDGMLHWDKSPDEVADVKHGNPSFHSTRGGGLQETLDGFRDRSSLDSIPSDDLTWLEAEFQEYNEANGYPVHIAAGTPDAAPVSSAHVPQRNQPKFESTRRYKWELRRVPFRWLFHCLGVRDHQWERRVAVKSSAK